MAPSACGKPSSSWRCGYFVFMLCGAFGYRVPPANWAPEGWTPPANNNRMITTNNVHLKDAHKTPQFWLIWSVLFLNVSAGIGVIGMASPMLQEIFGGKLIGLPDLSFTQLSAEQKARSRPSRPGFTGLLSLFNIGGRIFWASLSDKIGRKATYYTFFLLGRCTLRGVRPGRPRRLDRAVRVVRSASSCRCTAEASPPSRPTSPTYSARSSSEPSTGGCSRRGRPPASWGRLSSTTSAQFQIDAGVPRDQVYDFTMYILAGLLVLGLFANLAHPSRYPRAGT